MKRYLVIIGGGHSQAPFVKAANKKNLSTIVFDRNKSAPSKKDSTYFYTVSTHDNKKIETILLNLNKDLIGCITYSAHPSALKTTAYLNEQFKLKGISLTNLKYFLQKDLFHDAIKNLNIKTPISWTFNSIVSAQRMLKPNERYVVKPSRGGYGSKGINLVSYKDDLFEKKYEAAVESSLDKKVILQEFIDGEEYNISGFLYDDIPHLLLLCKKNISFETSGNRIESFENNSNDIPLLTSISLEVRKIFQSIKLRNTFFNIDIIVNGNDIFIIDFNLLLDTKIDRFLYFMGVDIYSLQIDLILNQVDIKAFDLIRNHSKKEATMRFIYDQPLAISLESKAKDTYSDIVYEPLLYVEDPIKNSKGNGERKLPVGILLGGK